MAQSTANRSGQTGALHISEGVARQFVQAGQAVKVAVILLLVGFLFYFAWFWGFFLSLQNNTIYETFLAKAGFYPEFPVP